jgi:hypothetical protein
MKYSHRTPFGGGLYFIELFVFSLVLISDNAR